MDYLLNHELTTAMHHLSLDVLNLIINGLPSKLKDTFNLVNPSGYVLNLIINGLPSKQNTYHLC